MAGRPPKDQSKVAATPAEPIAPNPQPAKPAPVAPTVTSTAPTIAAPQLRENPAPAPNGDNVWLVTKNGTRTLMTRKAAERYKRGGKNPSARIEG